MRLNNTFPNSYSRFMSWKVVKITLGVIEAKDYVALIFRATWEL